MTNRRGFLQSVSAALGSTLLPGSTVASVLTAAPVASAAVGVATVAAVARQFETTMLLAAQTFEPKLAVTMSITQEVDGVISGQTRTLRGDHRLEIGSNDLPSIDISSPEQMRISRNQLNLEVIKRSIKLEGLPPLTAEEEVAILEGRQPLVETAES